MLLPWVCLDGLIDGLNNDRIKPMESLTLDVPHLWDVLFFWNSFSTPVSIQLTFQQWNWPNTSFVCIFFFIGEMKLNLWVRYVIVSEANLNCTMADILHSSCNLGDEGCSGLLIVEYALISIFACFFSRYFVRITNKFRTLLHQKLTMQQMGGIVAANSKISFS